VRSAKIIASARCSMRTVEGLVGSAGDCGSPSRCSLPASVPAAQSRAMVAPGSAIHAYGKGQRHGQPGRAAKDGSPSPVMQIDQWGGSASHGRSCYDCPDRAAPDDWFRDLPRARRTGP